VCGTAGPGVVHLFNGLMDARKEGAAVIAIAGDVETSVIDTSALEELNPYKFFEAASLYTARVVHPEQARSVFHSAILTAILEKGPTVIALPGDVREGLAEALAHKDGPVVVDAVVDPFALSLPSYVPFHTAKGFTLSLAKQVWTGKMDDVIKTMERNIGLL
jgi:thiamine pyrophosphate-dependent acetolactate synthase large subunit-like protein